MESKLIKLFSHPNYSPAKLKVLSPMSVDEIWRVTQDRINLRTSYSEELLSFSDDLFRLSNPTLDVRERIPLISIKDHKTSSLVPSTVGLMSYLDNLIKFITLTPNICVFKTSNRQGSPIPGEEYLNFSSVNPPLTLYSPRGYAHLNFSENIAPPHLNPKFV